MKLNSHIPPTICKIHKGFRGNRRSEVHFNFSCNLLGNHPLPIAIGTLTALSLGSNKQP